MRRNTYTYYVSDSRSNLIETDKWTFYDYVRQYGKQAEDDGKELKRSVLHSLPRIVKAYDNAGRLIAVRKQRP